MGRRKIEIRVHPLLDELRPRLKRPARKALEKSLIRVGQLSEVLVTADDYILDGRDRYELVKELGMEPRIHRLTMHSGLGEMPNGYDREEELQMCREVIEETGRGRWLDSKARRTDYELVKHEVKDELVKHETKNELVTAPRPELLAVVPCDGNPIGIRLPAMLRAHLETMAMKHNTVRKKGRGNKSTVASLPEYIRQLCWKDFINHLPDTPNTSEDLLRAGKELTGG